MSTIEKISIAITREQLQLVRAAVERGAYATTSEVIRDALREWELKEEIRRLERERLGRLWDEGLASGPSVEGPPIMELLSKKYGAMAEAVEERPRKAKKRA